MKIEGYSPKHLESIVQIIKNFHAESLKEYDGIDPNVLVETVTTNAGPGTFLMTIDGVCQGILHGVITRSPLNGRDVFQEFIWYVNEPYRGSGVKMLNIVKNILKDMGVGVMIMVVMENSKTDKLKRLYDAMGFKLMESHYVRSL